MTPFEIVLAALEAHSCRPKERDRHVDALCPAHADRSPSLSLDIGDDGRALLYCFAGCATRQIMSALGLQMSDLFIRPPERRNDRSGGPKQRKPTDVQDFKYSITPGFLSESSDPWCVQLFDYLDLRQGSGGRFARGDQAIASALGWQARTVRTHALHLAGAGVIRIHKNVTASGAHRATEYEVLHNPGRKRFNENATTPVRRRRARPPSRIAASGLLTPANRANVARRTRDTSAQEDCLTPPTEVARSTRDSRKDVGRETRGVLGTQKGNGERDGSFIDELAPDGDGADASEAVLDQAPLSVAPPYDDAALAGLFADDLEPTDRPVGGDPAGEQVGKTENEAVSAVLSVFPGSELADDDDGGRRLAVTQVHCASCGWPVTPAPRSVEHGWATVCRACSGARR
jgi:hypothetical protein